MGELLPQFMTFVATLGSDEVVRSFFRFRVGVRNQDAQPPAAITMRLVSDFFIAVRNDVGVPGTTITGLEAFGMRINDIYSEQALLDAFTMPFDELATSVGWTPPWDDAVGN